MAKTAVIVVGVIAMIMIVIPSFGNGDLPAPKQGDGEPEFYFTNIDVYGHAGQWSATGASHSNRFCPWPWPRRSFIAFLRSLADGHLGCGLPVHVGYPKPMTNTKVYLKPHPVQILSPELFKYPYVYAVEPGQMELTQKEADRMREYLLRGGFWHVDDFWGLRQFAQFARQVKKIFPDREIVDIPLSHEIFHTFFDISEILQPPNDGNGRRYTQTNGQWPTWGATG